MGRNGPRHQERKRSKGLRGDATAQTPRAQRECSCAHDNDGATTTPEPNNRSLSAVVAPRLPSGVLVTPSTPADPKRNPNAECAGLW